MGDENKGHSNRDVNELTGKLANKCTLNSATKGSHHEHEEGLNPVKDIGEGHDGTDSQDSDPRSRELLQSLENFFSAPEFTTFVREFVEDNSSRFIVTEEGEEQPLRYAWLVFLSASISAWGFPQLAIFMAVMTSLSTDMKHAPGKQQL